MLCEPSVPDSPDVDLIPALHASPRGWHNANQRVTELAGMRTSHGYSMNHDVVVNDLVLDRRVPVRKGRSPHRGKTPPGRPPFAGRPEVRKIVSDKVVDRSQVATIKDLLVHAARK
jgi:hypothetical protein